MSEHNTEQAEISAPTTPGQAEGSPRPEQQSEPSPAPSQPNPAEGADEESR